MCRIDCKHTAFVSARGKSQPAVFRVSRRMWTVIHPYGAVRLGNLAINVDGNQPLRDRISLFQ